MSPGEGLALADSLDAAYKAGTLKLDKLLSAAAALSQHTDRQVAVALADSLLDLHDRVLDAAERRSLERRLNEIYGPRLRALGMDLRAGAYEKEPVEQQLLRRSLLRIVALGARDPDVRATLLQAARASLREPAALDTAVRGIAWGVAAQEDPTFADALIALMTPTQDGLVRQHAAGALGLSELPAIADKARTLAINPGTRTIETFAILGGQFDSPSTREAAWDWMHDNFDAVVHRLPGFAQAATFEFPAAFCDKQKRQDLEAFLAPKSKALGMGELELARSLERIDLCIAQKEGHAADMQAALGD